MLKKIPYLLSFIVVSQLAQSQPFNYHWAAGFGGRSQYIGAVDLVYSDFGLLYMTGDFTGTRDFGSQTKTAVGYSDVYLTLADTTGNIIWTVTGGQQLSYAYASAITRDQSSNTYITGHFINGITFGTFTHNSAGQNDIFIAKLDFAGNPVWVVRAGGSSFDQPSAIFCDDNNLYLTGHFTNSAMFGSTSLISSGANDQEIFIAKYDLNGNCIWAKSAGGSGEDHGGDIVKDASGNLAVCGNFSDQAYFGSNPVTSTAYYDIFIAKYDDNGNNIWVSRGGGKSNDFGVAIGYDMAGNYYVAGNNGDTAYFGSYVVVDNGYGNIFLTKVNSSGAFQWAKGGGSTSGDEVFDLSVAPSDGNCYLPGFLNGAGSFSGTFIGSNGLNDAIVLRYSSAGNVIFGLKIGGSNYDQGKAIASEEGGGVLYLMGEYTGTVTVGPSTLPVPPAANWQQFVARISTGTVGIDEVRAGENPVRLYPNPAGDFLTVELDRSIRGPARISVTDNEARQVYVLTTILDGASVTLPVTALNSGRYNLTVKHAGGSLYSHFVVVE